MEIVVLSTVSDRNDAENMARSLVREKLAACVNVIPQVRSFYEWKGKIAEDDELLLVVKTTREVLDRLITRIKELHPYELPEIISMEISAGLPDYLAWIRNSVSQ